jgi:hypothetical protein
MANQAAHDSLWIGSGYRANFKQIVAKRSDLVKWSRGRVIAPTSGANVVYNAGTLMGQVTSGGNAGKYKPYASGSSDGSQNPVGFLADDVEVDTLGNGSEIRLITGGQVYLNALIGLDAGGQTALKAKVIVEGGNSILDF